MAANPSATVSNMPQYRSIEKIRSIDVWRLFPGGLDRIWKEYIPQFTKTAGVEDLRSSGFRLVIDVPPFSPDMGTRDELYADIHLFSGDYTPNLCPQDWMTPKLPSWDPEQRSAFFDGCVDAAGKRSAAAPSGARIFLSKFGAGVFGVEDGDPKADTHILLMPLQEFAAITDADFSYGLFTDFFKLSKSILTDPELNIQNNYTRLCINSGLGYQSVARMHMHLMSFTGYVPKILPQCYGFAVDENGKVAAPEGSQQHQQILDKIADRRDIPGFDEGARQARRSLDIDIMALLRALPV